LATAKSHSGVSSSSSIVHVRACVRLHCYYIITKKLDISIF